MRFFDYGLGFLVFVSNGLKNVKEGIGDLVFCFIIIHNSFFNLKNYNNNSDD